MAGSRCCQRACGDPIDLHVDRRQGAVKSRQIEPSVMYTHTFLVLFYFLLGSKVKKDTKPEVSGTSARLLP